VSLPPRRPLSPPSPERDRALARKPRLGFRKAEGIDALVRGFLSSEEVRRMKRFAAVRGALALALNETELLKVKPISIRAGVLSLEVADGVLLGELRNHRNHDLLSALAAGGTAVTRIAWRLAKK
jgi:hypothetical protein